MWSKVLKSKTTFLVTGVVIGVLLFQGFHNSNNRYVKSFRRTANQEVTNFEETPKSKAALSSINQLTPLAKAFPWFSQLDEYLLVKVTDTDNALFSIKIKNGEVDIKYGWLYEEKPTLVLENIRSAHIKRLEQVLTDNTLEESEMFEIASVFLVPGLQALYNSDVLYLPGDKRFLKLDNHIQVELLNKYDAKDLEGNTIEAKATVANVDGYWLVFWGWQGEPDVRYAVDVNQMIQYYYLINYKFKGLSPSDLLQRKEILDEYMTLREQTLVRSSPQTN